MYKTLGGRQDNFCYSKGDLLHFSTGWKLTVHLVLCFPHFAHGYIEIQSGHITAPKSPARPTSDLLIAPSHPYQHLTTWYQPPKAQTLLSLPPNYSSPKTDMTDFYCVTSEHHQICKRRMKTQLLKITFFLLLTILQVNQWFFSFTWYWLKSLMWLHSTGSWDVLEGPGRPLIHIQGLSADLWLRLPSFSPGGLFLHCISFSRFSLRGFCLQQDNLPFLTIWHLGFKRECCKRVSPICKSLSSLYNSC